MSSDNIPLLTPALYSSATSSLQPPSQQLQQQPPSSSAATSAVIVIIVISSAVILSASIYLLLRFLSKSLDDRRRRHHQTYPNDVVLSRHSSSTSDDCHVAAEGNNTRLLDSLPLFTFRSVKGNLVEGDCAVCLSKFEPNDRLRLLPLCCHAFHAACIDAWIVANLTCPLCRSVVVTTERDVLEKIRRQNDDHNDGPMINNDNNNNSVISNSSNRSRSFRIEMGSISRRRGGSGVIAATEGDRRSYSVGSFEYIVDEIGNYEVSVVDYADKEPPEIGVTVENDSLAAEVGGGGGGGRSGRYNWLRDYVDRLGGISSRALSFRSSGRFFTGSSRRGEVAVVDDLEANRDGEEISELFRWLSGV